MNSRLYIAEVTHTRFRPVEHHFRYPAHTFAFDVDELPQLDATVRGFGHNRAALVSLHDRDYLQGDGSIRDRLMRVLRAHGCADGVARIELLTMPRVLNHAFNPVSFHYCYCGDGTVRCVVAEVNNTFGERHVYLLHTPEGNPRAFPLRYRHAKQFHVSPFNDMRGHYEFALSALGDELRIVLTLVRDGEKILTAVLRGSARPLDSANLAAQVLRHPFRILATVPRIAWQAALLHWRRGLAVYHKPHPSHPMTRAVSPPPMLDRWCMAVVRRQLAGIRHGCLTVRLPDGDHWTAGDAASPVRGRIDVWSSRFFRRVATAADVGLGESYTAGEWTSDDLPGLLVQLLRNLDALDTDRHRPGAAARALHRLLHARRRNTPRGSRRNIRNHYDLGNAFYRLWLDAETMMYSCALFEDAGQDLAAAQRSKLRRLIELGQIEATHRVLDLGCGWGGFAIEAARATGCHVTGITISPAQLEEAVRRVKSAGLEPRVELRLQDYRELEGPFDRVVSVEMIEALGHEYLGTFFERCDAVLRPGGRAVLQAITIPDGRYDAYRRNPDWIQKHIFPGGMLPSLGALQAAIASHSTLQIESVDDIGPHYVRTLQCWRKAFNAHADELRALGYDDAFQRKWNYYLAYCEAGFAAGYTRDLHLVLRKP